MTINGIITPVDKKIFNILAKYVFPIFMLFIILLLTFGTIGDLKLQRMYLEHHQNELDLSDNMRKILHFDEILTMSAKMAAATRDISYEKRYREYEPALDNAIKSLQLSQNIKDVAPYIKALDKSNLHLVKMENESFDLTRKGESSKALSILYSDEYIEQKQIYSNSINLVYNAAKKSRAGDNLALVRYQKKQLWTWAFILLIWIFLVIILHRSMAKQIKYENALQDKRTHLEQLVKDRVKEISTLNERLIYILGATKTGLDIIDSDFNVVYIDPMWAKVYGDHKGKKCYAYFMGRNNVCDNCGVKKALETKKPVVTEEILVREEGRPIEVTTIPFQDEKGNWLVAEINVDITERTKKDAELRKHRDHLEELVKQRTDEVEASEIRYRRLFEAAKDGILILNADTGNIIDVNKFLMDLLGYRKDEIVDKKLWEIGAFTDIEMSKKAFLELQTNGYVRYEDLPLEKKDGQLASVEFVSNVYRVDHMKVAQCNIRDITERKRLESISKEHEARFKEIFNKSRDGVLLADPETMRFTMWNKAMLDMLGYSEEEIKHLSVADIHPKKDMPRIIEIFKRSYQEKSPTVNEMPVKRKDGSVFYSETNSSAVFLSGKKHVIGSFRDITERKKAEEALRQSKQRLDLHVKQTPLGVIEWGMDFKIREWNPAAEKIFGFSSEEAIGKHSNIIVPETARESVDIAWQSLLKQRGGTRLTNNNVCKDGRIIICEWFNTPLIDEFGKTVGVASLVMDITEQERSREALSISEASYKAIFESASDGIVIRDIKNFKIVDANNKACEIFCYPKNEMLGLSLELMHNGNENYNNDRLKRLFDEAAHGEPQLFEWLVKDKLGREFWIETNTKRAVIGGQYRILSIVRDITERKQTISIKEDFMNMVSHELRTPLSAIKEGVSLLLEDKGININADKKEILAITKRNIDRLTRLINQVLDFQKFDAGISKPNLRENDINETINEVYRMMISEASKNKLEFKLNLDNKLPHVNFDKDRIIEVLINLVNNAIKYTKKGRITIDTGKGDNFIKVSVSDTGCGITEDDMTKLFKRFSQITRKVGGSGLGLAICKEIIESHNGKIWAESVFNKGSAFHFILPITERRK